MYDILVYFMSGLAVIKLVAVSILGIQWELGDNGLIVVTRVYVYIWFTSSAVNVLFPISCLSLAFLSL